ncbi:bifunctional glutamate--cysteine ligase GshA/glutathione synthetase GshB [Facklamia sp. DSM 111018]|uniref:glutamate--cysteine ligase n=1 Tax=Facklamia lactis TaxID=2749967 RepID=A0ABS0LSC4_9LACT|nr:bifunctional glutamate--cysteine ligase GshA/glutathione synthetase GshB [Facklamia lactis]MBG9981461.1 bifunctional glutamate--cysteine ligase GshA/glutathione synthetase GshB [Facklamia lactis]MBG9987063.1 bifunctional glutamate--cysteine ligase GshA/glutathione synthetase GshB [Facklamia lactis]
MKENPYQFQVSDIIPLWDSTIGLEREALRIDKQANISIKDHPSEWGSRSHHPYIQTDFAEGQIELITPPSKQINDIISWFDALHQIVETTISSDSYQELLWPFSMPPKLGNLDQVRSAQLDDPKEYQYRKYLIEVYGKPVQLVSGIHYNFQINPQLMEKYLPKDENLAIKANNEIYMSFARKYLYYRWALTYLLGASPCSPSEYFTKLYGKPTPLPMRSIRQSRYGYQNDPSIEVSYASLENFVNDVENHVQSGKLSVEKELYRDVRMRGGKPNREMISKGISYIEFRNFDLNPYSKHGITKEDITFIKIWLIGLLIHDQDDIDEDTINLADIRNRKTAEANPSEPLPHPDLLENFWGTLEQVANHLTDKVDLDINLKEIMQNKKSQLFNPTLTPSALIMAQCDCHNDFVELGLNLAHKHQKNILIRPYNLHGFEKLELSTQDLLKHAITKGVKVDLIDSSENILRLTHNTQEYYIKNANMTALDNQISYFLMENKVATKKILSEKGLAVPQGFDFTSLKQAQQSYPLFKGRPFVVKPKNTNYGLGINIFPNSCPEKEYHEAIEEAFKHDSTIIVEDFIQGTELRFYIQEGKTLAICERQPAQVIGDGKHSIAELIQIENKNPLRGQKHYAPLSFLNLGNIEISFLKSQGLTSESIPQQGEKVLLRKNSNVSSGGIAIDRTDVVHSDYLKIAELAATSLNTVFCGIDMIIKDYKKTILSQNDYAILEANFNPMMSLHIFPAIGKSRPLSQELLKRLFPTMDE